jgi:transmembrane sensor
MTERDNEANERDMLNGDAWNWVLRLTSGEATEADLADLKSWRGRSPQHAAAFAEASAHWQTYGTALQELSQAKALGHAHMLGSSRSRSPNMGRRAFLGGAMAATAAGAGFLLVKPPLDLWPSASALAADYRTGTGEQRRIALADSGALELNTRTSLNIRPASKGYGVVEMISGEATIAAEAHPIVVMAGNGRARAQSARFNMRCDGPTVSVTCIDGRVDVEHGGGTVSLSQNQQVAYTEQSLGALVGVEAANVTSWRSGELYFRNEPLAHVVSEINRYRFGHIFLMNDTLGQRRYTARLKLDRLDSVVTQFEASFGARVTKLPGSLIVIS